MSEPLSLDYVSVALPRTSGDVNEGDLMLGDDSDFEDVDKASADLGRTQPSEPAKNAEDRQKVAQINIEKTSVGLKIREVAWGELDTKGACRVLLDLRITSTTQFRITDTYLTCLILPMDVSQNVHITPQGQQNMPKILRFQPNDTIAYRKGVEGTSITTSKSLDPEISLGSAGFRIGSIAKQRTYQPFHGIDVSGDDNFSEEKILWSISNRTPKDRQTVYILEAELVVEHYGSDFCAKFELEAKLDFGSRIRALGKNAPVVRIRNFRVQPSIGVLT